MIKEYNITGMTCGGCVANVKRALESFTDIQSATIQLDEPQGKIDFEKEIPTSVLNEKLNSIGNYTIIDLKKNLSHNPKDKNHDFPEKNLTTYKPLILIVSFILGVSSLTQYPYSTFSGMLFMRHFMAGFFIVFSFFKLLNIEGFSSSYRMYDIVAARWNSWGLVYPFIELALGIAYLIGFNPILTNIITVVVLGVSSIGVIKSNLDKRKIKCACLGNVFNLPMSTVTVVEDVTMVVMAITMLVL